MVALDYFRRLGHDNHRRLSKLYAWKGKKCKTSWGAETVDLYCPGYNPRQSLVKDSNLARTAARYKVNTPLLIRLTRTRPVALV